jgi:catechol 2,3-dioxygenase-like lactoylglutathione lyase family enzyme
MTSSLGSPPKRGWAGLVPELLVEDLGLSLPFWRDILGFQIAYQRPEDRFVYLERPDGAQVMLCQRWGRWETGALERPFGRGVMFQIYIDDVATLIATLRSTGWPIVEGPRESWRQHGDREGGMREVFVQDPDGYLIMMAEHIGERPLG